ncbi:MAG: hypothetical protein K8T10_20090 [Candidatus Eremiobacteraeota bacterium]|nr:hypothetical protein [Candidatus Eremiobacteraeota bacterium]
MKKKYIGMDLGHQYANVAIIDQEKGDVSTTYRVGWDTKPDELKNEHEAMATALLKLPHESEVALSLPGDKVQTRYIELPSLRGDELQTAMHTEVRKFFPYNKNIHQMTHVEIPTLSGQKKRKGYLLIVIRKDYMEEQISLLRSVGFSIAHVDFPHDSLVRLYLWEDEKLQQGGHMFIHLMKDMILIGVFLDKALCFSRTIKPQMLDLPGWKQEEKVDIANYKPFAQTFAKEIAASLAFVKYRLVSRIINLDSIILSGQNCKDETLNSVISNETGMQVRVFESSKLKFKKNITPDKMYKYELACSLSLRVLEEYIWV